MEEKLINYFKVTTLIFMLISCENTYIKKKYVKGHQENIILYECPLKVQDFIRDSILNDKKIAYSVVDIRESGLTSMSLIYSDLSKRNILLSSITNRFFVIGKDTIPILFEEDFKYANIINDTEFYVQDFNFSNIEFNNSGEIIQTIKF